MEISRFFNSAPGDTRTYQASDFASYFGDVLSSGLLHTDNIPALEVKCEGTDLRTYVEPGKAIIQGYGYQNTANLYLEHALPEATLDRIDRIVLRLDKRNQSRFIKLFIKQGESASNPVPPALTRDEFIYELSLAQIRVRANTSTLNPVDLIDERLDENLCGLVYSLISIPSDQLQNHILAKMTEVDADAINFETQLAQNLIDYENEFNTWFDGLQTTGFASQTEFAQLQTDFNEHQAHDIQHVKYGVATGTANTYAVTLDPAPTSYVEGMAVSVKINIASTGASTLNINGLGAKGIKKANGTDVTNLKANGIYTFRYDGMVFILQGEGASGNALASDLLSGKTATTDAGEITGTMTKRVGQITALSTRAQSSALYATPKEGYYDGTANAEVFIYDAEFTPENILSGVNIFGVVGSLVQGKKWATGTKNSQTYTRTFTYANGQTDPKPFLWVSGLDFTPSVVLIQPKTGTNHGISICFPTNLLSSSGRILVVDDFTLEAALYTQVRTFRLDGTNATLTNGGFTLPVGGSVNLSYNWIAFE